MVGLALPGRQRPPALFQQMSASLILNPDRFAHEILLSEMRLRRAKSGARRAGGMCIECLHGQHDDCSHDRCTCIHLRLSRKSVGVK